MLRLEEVVEYFIKLLLAHFIQKFLNCFSWPHINADVQDASLLGLELDSVSFSNDLLEKIDNEGLFLRIEIVEKVSCLNGVMYSHVVVLEIEDNFINDFYLFLWTEFLELLKRT